MDPEFTAWIDDLYENPEQPGSDGQLHRLDAVTRISREQGEFLYRLTVETKAERTLEVGMAYGFSTLFFLAAHRALGAGCHTAVDPFENTLWHGIGLTKVEHSGCGPSFRWLEQTSIRALPALRDAGEVFDLVYIDGDHRFDAVIMDFHLADPLCRIGGHIVLDDLWMPSIRCAARFIQQNLPYQRVEQPIQNILVLRKTAEDQRRWDHFEPFLEERERRWPWRRRGAR